MELPQPNQKQTSLTLDYPEFLYLYQHNRFNKNLLYFVFNPLQILILPVILQSFYLRSSSMYYLIPDLTQIQPTLFFYAPFVFNYPQIQNSTIEYEITEANKFFQFELKDQLSLENNIKVQNVQESQEYIIEETRKNQQKYRYKQKLKHSEKSAEVLIEQVKFQKSEGTRRKSSNKLFFGMEWKNQNRNIIPNIMNQMLSFIQKKHKSELLIKKLFQKYSQEPEWSISKYFCYMKRIKASMGHYINQNQLRTIKMIQQPNFQIYSKKQQLFYLKICRIALDYFFKSQSILISLTSKRMSQQKRKAHLIARRALLQRVQQILVEDVE